HHTRPARFAVKFYLLIRVALPFFEFRDQFGALFEGQARDSRFDLKEIAHEFVSMWPLTWRSMHALDQGWNDRRKTGRPRLVSDVDRIVLVACFRRLRP